VQFYEQKLLLLSYLFSSLAAIYEVSAQDDHYGMSELLK